VYAAWTTKHKPRSLSEVIGNRAAIQKLVRWVESWGKGIPLKRAALLYGPPGVGKTVCVEALAKDLDMELVEQNASDYRTLAAVRRLAGMASRHGTLSGKKRLILLDELDGMTGTADRGGVRAITEVIKATQCPIVLTANNPYDPRFTTLRKHCLLIEFKKPPPSEVTKHLRKICLREGIEAEEEALRFIALRSGGDVRSAVNDLQALAQGKRRLTYDDVAWLAHRDRKEAIFNVLRLILYGRSCQEAKRAIDMADVDHDMLFEWIYENIPYHTPDPQDLARAMDALAKADLYRGRIRTTKDWGLTRYVVDFMTAGVAMAREGARPATWTPLRFPERIRMLSRIKQERQLRLSIGRKIRKKCHISSVRAVREVLPYLHIIFESNPKMAAGLARWLDLDQNMIRYLAGDEKRAKTILEQTFRK